MNRSFLSIVLFLGGLAACNKAVQSGGKTAKAQATTSGANSEASAPPTPSAASPAPSTSANNAPAPVPIVPSASPLVSASAPPELAEDIPVPGDRLPPTILTKINNRNVEDILCQQGPKITARAGKDDFTNIFAVMCQGKSTSEKFKGLITSAYDGKNKPVPAVFEFSFDSMFITKMIIGFATKVPAAGPSVFGTYGLYDRLKQGIAEGTSKLIVEQTGRRTFPGAGSVEELKLSYTLLAANGAGLFDRRTTETNTYTLVESSQDMTFTTEHLLDGAKNEYWNTFRSIIVGIKGPDNISYLVTFTEIVAINRIDPLRLKNTLVELSAASQKVFYSLAVPGSPK